MRSAVRRVLIGPWGREDPEFSQSECGEGRDWAELSERENSKEGVERLWSGVGLGPLGAMNGFLHGMGSSERCWELLVEKGDVGGRRPRPRARSLFTR